MTQHIVTASPQKGRRSLARSQQDRLTRENRGDAEMFLLIIGVIRDRRGMRRGAETTCLGRGCTRRTVAQRPTTVSP